MGSSFYLIYGTRVKNCMERIKWTSFIVLSTVLALVIQLLIINSVMAQAPNTTLEQNRTKRIVDLEKHTITIVDKITNETISVKNFLPNTSANMTKNETLTANGENATTNEILTPVEPTINGTISPNTENATTTVNLTDKFDTLQGK